jgi:CRISPR-associated protein Cas1
VVDAKIRNALFIVRQHRKNHPEKLSDADLAKFDQLLARAAESTSLETLRGLEGAATAAYFQLFGRMLNPPWQFQTRTRRPPLDPVNAVLSFGYVIVGAELQSVLDGVGFDPYLGFYHAIEYGRPGLALDLLEEFRHSIVDRLALNLFNTHVVTNGDFFTPPRGGVYMNTSGKKKFFEHYEKMLGEYVGQLTIGPPAGDSRSSTGKRSFRAIFQQQVQALAKAVMGEKEYEPFQMK